MQLYNKLSAKERSALIDQAGKDRLTISFYQYAKIGNPQVFRDTLFIKWDSLGVLGRIYVANASIRRTVQYRYRIFLHLPHFRDRFRACLEITKKIVPSLHVHHLAW